MIPKNQTFDNSKRNLLSAQRGMKEPKKIQIFREGKVANSGASLQPKKPDPEAGRQESEDAKLIGMMKDFVFGKGMLQEQYQDSEKERGIASWERATSDQREGYEKAIKNGWINSKESPYFRESVTNAYTDNLVHKASLKMWTEYEKWPDKNNPSSGSLENFFQQQEDAIAINLETIPDETLKNRFYEQWQAQKRELTRKHGNYLNAEYNAKAQDEIDNLIYNRLVEYDGVLSQDFRNSKVPLSQMLDKQRYTRADLLEVSRVLEAVTPNGKLPPKELEELQIKAATRGGVYKEVYEGLTHNTDADPQVALAPYPMKEGTKIPTEVAVEIAKVLPSNIEINDAKDVQLIEKHLESIKANAPVSGDWEKMAESEKFFTFAGIISPAKPAVSVGESVISSMVLGLKNGESAVAMAEHPLTVKGGPLIKEGGGANGTLPVFLATSKDYPPDVQTFADQFALSLEKQRTSTLKIWHGYLDKYYSGKKGATANIWKPDTRPGKKGKWFINDWENANFNLIQFKSYVTKMEEEGKI
jgi:hypothetical protein